MSTDKKLIARRHDLIPGAAHTYSKGDDQFPANAPKVIIRGKGAYCWDEHGKKYIDWCMGLRSVSLGHCFEPVNRAVRAQMSLGTNFGRPSLLEFELADILTSVLPNADMVKFAKNGSTVTTAATKLARAFTGRKYIALCKDHPFFSYDDWFIGTTPCNAGIPEEISKLSLTFRYNDISSLEKLFQEHPGEIACVIMEAITTEEPSDNFLLKAEALVKKNGAIFILDEMITGFRFGLQGAQKIYGLKPDLSTYGKGIANGYSLSVLAGRRDIMERGGIYHDKERVFLISTTHGAENISLAAARATITFMKHKKVAASIKKYGTRLEKGLTELIERHCLSQYIGILGFPPNLTLTFNDMDGNASFVLKTLFLQEVAKRGILFQGYFAISYSHQDKEIATTLGVFDEVLGAYKIMLENKSREQYLLGHAVKPVFRKYN